jgi:tungstate transport system substrate-binding protein
MSDKWEITLSLGEGVPGRELLRLLEEISASGSLSRAADRAGLSYRYAWGLLNRAEAALGKGLVTRRAGGAAGGGSVLTGEGARLLGLLRALQREVQGQVAALLDRPEEATGQILLASTLEPVATGLLDLLEQAYYEETGVMVRHVAAGSGQALAMARAGRVDVTITHAPHLEEKFVRQGFGLRRLPFMSNDFLLAGHISNTAGLNREQGIVDALRLIAERGVAFISRGDQSGTHLLEQELWRLTGLDPAGQPWYFLSRSVLGSYDALRAADRRQGYTLVDRSSFLTGGSGLDLAEYISGEDILINVFSVIAVSRNQAPVNQQEAERFARWLSGQYAAALINEFGSREYGTPLFKHLSPE